MEILKCIGMVQKNVSVMFPQGWDGTLVCMRIMKHFPNYKYLRKQKGVA